jgi:hypothetical protein
MLTIGHYDIEEKRSHLKLLAVDDVSCAIEYQPGDGTRYVVRFNKMSENERRAYGCSPDCLLMVRVVGPNQFKGMTVDGYTHPNYLSEKLECNPHTAGMLCKLIEYVFHGTDVGPSLYETEAAR